MEWVLIIAVKTVYAMSIATQTFADEAACRAAGESFEKIWDNYDNIHYSCTPRRMK